MNPLGSGQERGWRSEGPGKMGGHLLRVLMAMRRSEKAKVLEKT
jgi:hypothetical protein